jgi:pimeloyl-ACP methyl ester carboxylesterase
VNENYEEQLRSLSVPVTFVWGETDMVTPLTDAERAMQLLPAGLGSLHVLKGIGHMTLLEGPGAINAAIRGQSIF